MTDDEYILQGYRDADGRFTRLPGRKQRAKFDAMICSLAQHFEINKEYSELEVNTILNQHHTFQDPATLRRFLCSLGYLDRTLDGRVYTKHIQ